MIARCGINSSYMPKLPSMFRLGWNYLKYLDISGNPLEDEGISSLAEGYSFLFLFILFYCIMSMKLVLFFYYILFYFILF